MENPLQTSNTAHSPPDSEIVADTLLFAGNGSTLDVDSLIVTGDGVVGGTGTFPADFTNAGTLAPGDSAGAVGTFAVDGDYKQTGAGTLAVELRGLTAGTEHDELAVAGTGDLDGLLAVSVPESYVPQVGDRFTVLTCEGGCTGRFDAVEAISGYGFEVQYGAEEVTLEVISSEVPVELVAFEAAADADAIVLTWRTASETDNAGFEIQRAPRDEATGQRGDWERVVFVEGHGTATEAQSYRYTDHDLPYETQQLVYRLRQVDLDGTFAYSPEIEVGVDVPKAVVLHGNFPNPFRAATTVRYELPQAAPVRLTVHDLLGRTVATLVDALQAPGRRSVRFNPEGIASGVYLYRLEADAQMKTRRMLIVR